MTPTPNPWEEVTTLVDCPRPQRIESAKADPKRVEPEKKQERPS